MGGLKEGDFIVELSGVDVKWFTQQQLVKLVQNSKLSLELKVITPIDRNYLKVNSKSVFYNIFYNIFVNHFSQYQRQHQHPLQRLQPHPNHLYQQDQRDQQNRERRRKS